MNSFLKKKIHLSLLYFIPVLIVILLSVLYAGSILKKDSSYRAEDGFEHQGSPEKVDIENRRLSSAPLEEASFSLMDEPEFLQKELAFSQEGTGLVAYDIQADFNEVQPYAKRAISFDQNYPDLSEDVEKTISYRQLLYIALLVIVLFALFSYRMSSYVVKPLVESQKRQKQFIDDASHELRTPLSLLRTEIDLYKRKNTALSNTEEKFISRVDFSVSQLEYIVNQLLDYTRLGSNELSNESKKMENILELLEKNIAQFESQLSEKNIKLHFSPSLDIYAQTHAELLNQILRIILDNAIKHNVEGGYVEIYLWQNPSSVCIEVKNTTAKNSMQQSKDLFKRFYRSDKNRTNAGLGLGLSIASELSRKSKIDYKIHQESNIFTSTLKI